MFNRMHKLLTAVLVIFTTMSISACTVSTPPTTPPIPDTSGGTGDEEVSNSDVVSPPPTEVVPDNTENDDTQDDGVVDDPSSLANPASVYCEEQGGILEIRDSEEGQTGFCLFDDGSECEEWAYYNGECAPGDSIAEEDAYAGWATYTNDEYGFAFRYPSDWTYDDLQPNRIAFRWGTFEEGEIDFNIWYKYTEEEVMEWFQGGGGAGDFVTMGYVPFLGANLEYRVIDLLGKIKGANFYVPGGIFRGDLQFGFGVICGGMVPYEDFDISQELLADVVRVVESFTLNP